MTLGIESESKFLYYTDNNFYGYYLCYKILSTDHLISSIKHQIACKHI